MLITAPACLNIGETGSGKTFALTTLAQAGLDVYHISTEPNGMETLLDAWKAKKLPIEKLKYRSLVPARAGFEGLLQQSKLVASTDQKFLSDQKPSANRANAQFIQLIGALSNFVDERTGESFGSVEKLGSNCALSIDSLSGINAMAMDMVIGDKVTANPGEWGIAMKMLDKLLLQLTSSLNCTLVITAHMEKELDENTGSQKVMVSTLGKKLAPTIPRFFSEVFQSYREGDQFYWSTTAMNVALKVRSLPLGSKLDPDYGPIVKRYKERIAFASGTQEPKLNQPITIGNKANVSI